MAIYRNLTRIEAKKLAGEANSTAELAGDLGRRRVDLHAYKMAGSYAAVHLHDEGARESAPARCQSARRHLAVVLLRRQDRRAGPERRRQELAPQERQPDVFE